MKIFFFFRRNSKNKSGISLKIWKIERRARRVTVWWGGAVMKHRRPVPSRTLQVKRWRLHSELEAIEDEKRRIREQLAQGYERRPSKRFLTGSHHGGYPPQRDDIEMTKWVHTPCHRA